MIQGVFFIQKYAALRLLQKYSKISGFCLRQFRQLYRQYQQCKSIVWRQFTSIRRQCSSNLSLNFSPSGRIYNVLRTYSRIHLPLVELMMFCRTDYRFWLALLCIAPASAYGICVKTLPYGREWARDCSKNDHSARITPWKIYPALTKIVFKI